MVARFVKTFFLPRFSTVGYFMQKTASALTPQLLLKKEKSKTSSYLLQTSLARKLWIIDSMRGVYLVHYSMTIWINNTPDVHRLQGDRRHQFDKENFNLREYQKNLIDCWSNFSGKSNPIGACVPVSLGPVGSSEFLPLNESSAVYALGGWERATGKALATIQSWSWVIINSGRISVTSGFAKTSGVALGCIHVCFPFWCDPSGGRGEHNVGSSRFVRNSNKCRSMQLSNAPLMLMLWWWWW